MSEEKGLWSCEIDIPWELEDSIIWKLKSLKIKHFAFESSPEENYLQKLTIWLHPKECSVREKENLWIELEPLGKVFGVQLNLPKWTKIQELDWNLEWKKKWNPNPVGKNFLVLPAWIDLIPEEYKSKQIIRIDPGCAFGTGSHQSTQLCLEAMEEIVLKNLSVVDLGCGSGILSIAALSLQAKTICAADIDPFAVQSTLNNLKLNNFNEHSYSVIDGSIVELNSKLKKNSTDLLLCNILAPEIKNLAWGFDSLLSRNGKALLSGLLAEQIPDLTMTLNHYGWTVSEIHKKNSWAMLEIIRDGIE